MEFGKCPTIAGDPRLGAPRMAPGQARDLGPTRVPAQCALPDTLPWDGADAGPGNPRSYLGMGKNWINGEYKGGSSACYQNQPLEPMFPRQARWLENGMGYAGGWWPTYPDYNGGVLVKPSSYCPAPWYNYDALAPWGLKGF